LWFIPGTVNVVGDDAWIDGFEMFLGAPELEALDEHAASSTNATANHAKLRTLLLTGTETHIARSGVFSPRHPVSVNYSWQRGLATRSRWRIRRPTANQPGAAPTGIVAPDVVTSA
jgi:hypothetical protein